MDIGFNYNIDLIEKVSDILAKDFWVYQGFDSRMLPHLSDPIKFSANCSIFLKDGECEVEIDLIKYKVKAPSILNIRRGQILTFLNSSPEFNLSFIVISKRFSENLFLMLKDFPSYHIICNCPTVNVPAEMVRKFENFYSHIVEIFQDSRQDYAYHAMVMAIASFFYECGHFCYKDIIENYPKGKNHLSEKFISLVQQNFKQERFLNYYSEKIGVSAKHLSRSVKDLTGFSAVEWIDRYVILEAKVMLKATNLTIQQISDELNFTSQSFFGKYFKKHTGVSPKDFRNS